MHVLLSSEHSTHRADKSWVRKQVRTPLSSFAHLLDGVLGRYDVGSEVFPDGWVSLLLVGYWEGLVCLLRAYVEHVWPFSRRAHYLSKLHTLHDLLLS